MQSGSIQVAYLLQSVRSLKSSGDLKYPGLDSKYEILASGYA